MLLAAAPTLHRSCRARQSGMKDTEVSRIRNLFSALQMWLPRNAHAHSLQQLLRLLATIFSLNPAFHKSSDLFQELLLTGRAGCAHPCSLQCPYKAFEGKNPCLVTLL